MLSPELNIERARWPADPYGYDHATCTIEAALTVARSLKLGMREDEPIMGVVRAVAAFHDLGRKAPWHQPDHDHAVLSADMAAHTLKDDPNWRAHRDLIDRVRKVIAEHNIASRKPGSSDPVAICLWDADILESARLLQIDPGLEGMVYQRYSMLVTPFGRDPGVQKRWMDRRRVKEGAGQAWQGDRPMTFTPGTGF